jgi:hypothetical protein
MKVRSLPLPPSDGELVTALAAECVRPIDLIGELLTQHDVVFLGENHGVLQYLNFVIDHIGDFAAAGVTAVAMEFGASEFQAELDALTRATTYDEQRVRELMFEYNVGWVLQEYQDVARAVWQHNQRRDPALPPFRVLNLSYRYNWDGWSGERTPQSMAPVQYRGPIDVFRADILEREVLDRGTKCIALMGTPHALRADVWPYQPVEVSGFDNPARAWTAQVLADRYPDRVASVVLHAPVSQGELMTLPSGGVLDALAVRVGQYGLLLQPGSAAGNLSPGIDFLPEYTWSDIADGYMAMAPLRDLRGCHIDTGFVTEANWDRLLREWPDIDWNPRPTSLAAFYAECAEAGTYPEVWGIAQT